MRRAHWGWQDPLEASLLPAVSADSLMTHARAIAARAAGLALPGSDGASMGHQGLGRHRGQE